MCKASRMRLLSLPCCLPPPSLLCPLVWFFVLWSLSTSSLPIQLVCLSLLQKHDHIVEMCGACNSEQVREREGGEGGERVKEDGGWKKRGSML